MKIIKEYEDAGGRTVKSISYDYSVMCINFTDGSAIFFEGDCCVKDNPTDEELFTCGVISEEEYQLINRRINEKMLKETEDNERLILKRLKEKYEI